MRWGTMTTKAKATVVVAVAAVIWVGGVASAGALVGAVVSNAPATAVAPSVQAKPLLSDPAPDGSSTPVSRATPTQTPTPTPTPKTVVTEVSERTSVPFSRTTVEDATVPKGESHVTTAGVDGAKTTYYRVTTVDGVETEREQVRQVLNRAPVAEVTTIGTFVAPAPAPAPNAPEQHSFITPGAYCASAESGVVAQAANGRSYQCGGHGPDANGRLHWNTM